jgi:hypothetical protein
MSLNDLYPKFNISDSNGYLALNVSDKNGHEYFDGSIVQVGDKIGVIRYSFGRFEIVCAYLDQRFIYGLNPSHEIIGHIGDNETNSALEVQASQRYVSNS